MITAKHNHANMAERGISTLYPQDLRCALVDVQKWPRSERAARIAKLTAEAVRIGLARNPSEDGGWMPPSMLRTNIAITSKDQEVAP
jgi:hypothetical protein